MEIQEEEETHIPQPLSPLTVAIVVNGNRDSKYAVKWALEKFIPEGRISFKLLHVRPRITRIPTPMGNFIPISKVREDVADAYRKEIEWRVSTMLLPFRQMCAQRQVEVEPLVIEGDDVAEAISEEANKSSFSKLVVGASSRNAITRKFKGPDLATRISECAPSFCTIYVVSRGKLSSVRVATSSPEESTELASDEAISFSESNSSSYPLRTVTGGSDTYLSEHRQFRSSSLPLQRHRAISTVNYSSGNSLSSSTEIGPHNSVSLGSEVDTLSHGFTDDASETSSYRTFQAENESWFYNRMSATDTQTEISLSECPEDLSFEVERLRIELRHAQGMYAMARDEAVDASRKAIELRNRQMEEVNRLKEIRLREEKAQEVAKLEKGMCEAANREAEYARECVEREISERRDADNRALREAQVKHKIESLIACLEHQYQKFSWEEIVSATSSFSDSLKIGSGAYGSVYKCSLRHTMAAVKVLHSNEGHQAKHFQQELDILNRIRHPHLLLLLGACPDEGCLVYEYMENGSLEDRLLQKNGTPPLPWFDRFRIAWEVASALVFLHNSKPTPIVHRDLKPANILLDRNLTSKIGDVGLSTLLPSNISTISTAYKETSLVGTFCYVDPEYVRTGVVSSKSDLYAFGIIILQLLTAKPAMALANYVETALEGGKLEEILDLTAGKWPLEETQELALLALGCAELRRRDRPDLKTNVFPVLERLKEKADLSRGSIPQVHCVPPSHFICPIFQDVMENPCVAADGYTYEHRAIDKWLSMNDKSPMTNLPMPHKNLVPNFTLLSAIMEWKSGNQ
ncbi:hypothetical protein AMTRI_Chr13g83240 [Amborella trichopoda]